MDNAVVVGIDIGFGLVKVHSEKKSYKFSSALITPSMNQGINLGAAKKHKVYELDGESYLVGEAATPDKGYEVPIADISELIHFSPLFVQKVLEDLGLSELDTVLALGLPIGEFVSDGDGKTRLKNRVKKHINIKKVYVFPQGVGARLFLKQHELKKVQNYVIYDIGFNTVDVVFVLNGGVNQESSYVIPNAGVGDMAAKIQDYLRIHFRHNTKHSQILNIIKDRRIIINRETIDLSGEIRGYMNGLMSTVAKEKKQLLNTMERIVVVGGGAHYLPSTIKGLGSDIQEKIMVPQNPEYLNARGFYERAKELWAAEKAKATAAASNERSE